MVKERYFNVIILSCLLGLIVTVTVILSQHSFTSPTVKDFSFQQENGQTGHLFQFKEPIIILHFWASWCQPCREELPPLLHMASISPEKAYLLISADQNKQQMLDFLKPYRAKMLKNVVIIHDPDMTITRDQFDIDQFPETLILNKDKAIIRHYYGMANWENIYE